MKVLWIDDAGRDREYLSLRRQLERLAGDIETSNAGGGSVKSELTVAVDPENFYDEAVKGDYDLAVVDYKIPPTSGIEVARRLLSRVGNIRVLFLSAWVVQFNPAGKLDPRAVYAVVQKPEDGDDIELWFAEQLRPAASSLMSRSLVSYSAADRDYLVSLEIIPRDRGEFDEMGFDEQMERIDTALAATRQFADSLFEDSDAYWFAFTWPDLVVVYWGGIDSSIDETKLVELEHEYDAVVLRAGRPLEVGEVGSTWSDCRVVPGESRGAVTSDSYPTLEVEIEDWRTFLNVDTGSVCSFLSLKDLESARLQALIPPKTRHHWQWEDLQVGPERRAARARSAVLERIVDVASLSGTIAINLRVRIIDDFYKTGLARSCRVGRCSQSEQRSDGQYWCGHRKGLIGRDILRLNDILLVLDSLQRRSYVVVPGGAAVSQGFGESPSTPEGSRYVGYSVD